METKRARAVLFGEGKAFGWSVSIRQVGEGHGAYIVTAKNENKCRLKIVCLGRIARRLLVFEDEDWICEKFLASFSTLDSALQRYMPRTEGARDRRF